MLFCPDATTYGDEETWPIKYKILADHVRRISLAPRQILETQSHLRVGFAPNRPPPLPPLAQQVNRWAGSSLRVLWYLGNPNVSTPCSAKGVSANMAATRNIQLPLEASSFSFGTTKVEPHLLQTHIMTYLLSCTFSCQNRATEGAS